MSSESSTKQLVVRTTISTTRFKINNFNRIDNFSNCNAKIQIS